MFCLHSDINVVLNFLLNLLHNNQGLVIGAMLFSLLKWNFAMRYYTTALWEYYKLCIVVQRWNTFLGNFFDILEKDEYSLKASQRILFFFCLSIYWIMNLKIDVLRIWISFYATSCPFEGHRCLRCTQKVHLTFVTIRFSIKKYNS